MVLHVYGVTSAGGVPLFYRSSGNDPPLSFSDLASLNGIQVFSHVHTVTFRATKGKDFNIFWKNVTPEVTLILICKRSVCDDGELILDFIFDAMVFTVGIDELTSIKYVDRLKKELKPVYSLIDSILNCVDELPETNNNHVPLVSMVQVYPHSNALQLQEKLNEWSERISSLFTSLMTDNKIVVATSGWWDLSPAEKSIITRLININRNFTTIDVSIFLPNQSPHTAVRLVACRLMGDIWVSALCGLTPSLVEFERAASICWSPKIETLTDIPKCTAQILPNDMSSQNGIFGSIFINTEIGNYILLGLVNEDRYFFDSLRIFYYQNIKEMMKENENNSHKLKETYWLVNNYKLYGIINPPHVICVITSSALPIPAVRSISKDMLSIVVNKMI